MGIPWNQFEVECNPFFELKPFYGGKPNLVFARLMDTSSWLFFSSKYWYRPVRNYYDSYWGTTAPTFNYSVAASSRHEKEINFIICSNFLYFINPFAQNESCFSENASEIELLFCVVITKLSGVVLVKRMKKYLTLSLISFL